MIPYAVDTWTAACVHMLLGMCTHVTNASYTCLLTHATWHVYTRHFSCVHMIFYACVHMLCMHVYTCVCACVHMIDFEHVYTWFPACVHMRSWHMLLTHAACWHMLHEHVYTCYLHVYTCTFCMCQQQHVYSAISIVMGWVCLKDEWCVCDGDEHRHPCCPYA